MVTKRLFSAVFWSIFGGMAGFIRKVRTGSGATAVQIVYKHGREVVGINHIGFAHNKVEIDILVARAKEVKDAAQLRFDFFDNNEPEIYLRRRD